VRCCWANENMGSKASNLHHRGAFSGFTCWEVTRLRGANTRARYEIFRAKRGGRAAAAPEQPACSILFHLGTSAWVGPDAASGAPVYRDCA
jgi:hypothetical protein